MKAERRRRLSERPGRGTGGKTGRGTKFRLNRPFFSEEGLHPR